MKKLTLAEYCESHSQTAAARALGVTRAAIHQMINGGRNVFVEIDEAGNVLAWEKRQIPVRKHSVAA